MTFNRIQFQPGMPLPELLRCFGTKAHSAAARKAARWPRARASTSSRASFKSTTLTLVANVPAVSLAGARRTRSRSWPPCLWTTTTGPDF